MSASLCTHSYHDEIFNFTDVERTNTEINIHLFDNANDYRIKTSWKKSNDRQTKQINPNYKKIFTVSVKYKIYMVHSCIFVTHSNHEITRIQQEERQ